MVHSVRVGIPCPRILRKGFGGGSLFVLHKVIEVVRDWLLVPGAIINQSAVRTVSERVGFEVLGWTKSGNGETAISATPDLLPRPTLFVEDFPADDLRARFVKCVHGIPAILK